MNHILIPLNWVYSRPEDQHRQRQCLHNTCIFHLLATSELVSVKISQCKEEDACALGEHLLGGVKEHAIDRKKKKMAN